MQKTVEVPVYTFDELAPEVQQRLIDDRRSRNNESGWTGERLGEDLELELEQRNMKDVKAYWSMYGRGHGVALDGTLDLADLLAAETEDWGDSPTNVHLKPSAIKAVAPNLLEVINPNYCRWALTVPGNSLVTRVSDGSHFEQLNHYLTEVDADPYGPVSLAEASAKLTPEAEALQDLIEEHVKALTDGLLSFLYSVDEDMSSDSYVREELLANSEGVLYLADGQVL